MHTALAALQSRAKVGKLAGLTPLHEIREPVSAAGASAAGASTTPASTRGTVLPPHAVSVESTSAASMREGAAIMVNTYLSFATSFSMPSRASAKSMRVAS